MPWLSVLRGWRLRRISTEAYIENMRRCALVKSLSKLHRTGIVRFKTFIALSLAKLNGCRSLKKMHKYSYYVGHKCDGRWVFNKNGTKHLINNLN